MARVKFGDVVEIPLENGHFAYAIYTHEDTQYLSLLRVFDATFESPQKPEAVLGLPVRFNQFFPMNAAIKKKMIRVVGNAQVPEQLKALPVFRSGNEGPSGKIKTWFLQDGDREWRVTELTPEERKLSILEIPSFPMLQEMISTGWRPETDPR